MTLRQRNSQSPTTFADARAQDSCCPKGARDCKLPALLMNRARELGRPITPTKNYDFVEIVTARLAYARGSWLALFKSKAC